MQSVKEPSVSPSILVVDDEIYALQGYEMQLLGEGITDCICCMNGKQALEVLSMQTISLILLDLRMPEISGEELLETVSRDYPEIPVIVVTAVDDVETAVGCMKQGAFNYILKPVDHTRLMTEVKRALEFRELRHENLRLQESVLDRRLKHPEAFCDIITDSEKMLALFKYIESIAPSSQPVLVTGETGAGKEMIVRAIHTLSQRKGEFVAVNVAGLDENTFSDTLFGHKRGAFTGADRARDGLIEKAVNGTLFLDEIGDLPLTAQVKLLRLLQEREYYPLGADTAKPTNTRVVVATNCNLLTLQTAGKFRADLYYRLVLHRIQLPPLRERQEDFPLLVEYFLQEAADELRKNKPTPPPELFPLLSLYPFPGNIRELRAMIFDVMSYHQSGKLSLKRFKEIILQDADTEDRLPLTAQTTCIEELYTSLEQLPSLQESESFLIEEALRRTRGNQTLTASLLGITRQTLHRRLYGKRTRS